MIRRVENDPSNSQFEADPGVYTGLRTHYDGPLSLAKDLMVWNVTPKDIATRHVVVNPDSWPTQHGGGKSPEKLTWEPHHPMSEWLAAGRLSWPGVDEFDK